MATVNLGRVGLVLKGEYDASTKYEKLDVVTYQGSSYIAKQATTGNAPTNESFWQLQSEKGEKGDKGDAGGGLTRLDDQTPVTVDGVLAGKNGKLAPADFVPAEILPTNTVAQAGIVAAPTANNSNALWSTDGSGNPAWRQYDYQTKTQIQQLIATAISESGHASFEKVDEVPTPQQAQDNILYLVYNDETEHYDIYAKVGNEVLLIDDTTVDLTNYATLQDLDKKVDAVPGKQLSTNDYTTVEKDKLTAIEGGAEVNTIETVKVNGTVLTPDSQKAVNIIAYTPDNKPEIGGKNLYFGTKDFSGSFWINLNSWQREEEKYDGMSVISRSSYWEGVYQKIKALVGETYTFSCYAKANKPTKAGIGYDNVLEGRFEAIPINSNFDIGTEWKRLSQTFSITKGGVCGFKIELRQEISEPDSILYVCGIKVERGEIATDWTPAFEDIQSMASVKSVNGGVGDVEIGGTNLLKGSHKEPTNTTSPGYNHAVHTRDDLSHYGVFPGDNVVFSFEVSDSTYPVRAQIRVYFSDGSQALAGEGNLLQNGKTYASAKIPDNVVSMELLANYNVNMPNSMNIYHEKLEHGTVPTDWSPAPEDLEAEIPIKTSELQNDSGFITQADIPEGAAASNTVPKAPAATGSVGSEMAFARGDHVHPFSEYEFVPRGDFERNTNIDDLKIPGAYRINDYSIVPGATLYGVLIVTKAFFNDNVITQIFIPNTGNVIGEKLYYRNFWHISWQNWIAIKEPTASNFSGILPIEKGGTNNSLATSIQESISAETFRSQIGQQQASTFIAPSRHETGSEYWVEYSSGIKFGVGGTHGYISPSYFAPRVDVGGGNNNKILWHKQLAFSDQIPSIATSSTAGLIKPGTGCEVTSDGTLNVTASGGISEIPVASATTLGGVKIGDNMKVTEDGTLTANLDGYWSNTSTLYRLASINLPNIAFMAYNYASGSPGYVLPTSLIASKSNLGLIKTGTGLTIDTNGVVSVDSSNLITSSGGTLNDKAEIALGDQATLKVNDYNGDHRLWLEIKPTESNLNDIEFCLGRYIDFRVDNSGTLVIHTSAPFDGFERELHLTGFKAILLNGSPNHRVISSYDYATTSEAGIVKVGSGLSVDGEGTLSVDSQSTTNNFINLKALYVHEAAAPSIDPDVNGFTIYATGIYPSRTSEEADVTTNSVINIDSADVSNVNCYFKATPINTAGTLASEDDAQSFLSGSMEFQFNQSRVTFGNYGSAKIFINTVLKSSVAKTIVELPSYTSTGTTYAALAEILRSAGITRLQCNGLSKQKLDLYG